MLGQRPQGDFEDEIKSHLELEVERLKGQGMNEADARLAARRKFGNVGVAEDRFYHGQRLASVEDAVRDMKHAWRGLTRSPGFLVTSVLTLSLAMGAVSGMFGVVNKVMIEPLPYPEPGQLYYLQGQAPGTDLPDTFDIALEFYVHYKENSKHLASIFTFGGGTSTFRAGDRVERIQMMWPTNDMYATLGVKPQLGRLPRTEDKDDVVLISDYMWSSWFNRDSSVIGKWYFVSDSMKQVIGVMPASFKFPSDSTKLWVSGEIRPSDIQIGTIPAGQPVIARFKEGVTPAQVETEMKQLGMQVPARWGAQPVYTKAVNAFKPMVRPLKEASVDPVIRTALVILFGAVAVVLLVACANVANLFTVRAESRRRDFTVRRAIGASRLQLMRFQLAEAFVIALAAGVLAIGLAAVTMPAFVRAAPQGIARLNDVRLDLPMVAATFLLVLFVALVCGVIPAIRSSQPDLTGLRAGGRGSIGGRQWGRDLLVVTQTALALVLLIGAALLVQSFNKLKNVDAGYNPNGIYTFQFAPQQPTVFTNGPAYGQLHNNMMNRIRALPGVSSVGIVENIPLDEGTRTARVKAADMVGEGDGYLFQITWTGGDYFKTIGIKLLEGRAFTSDEAVSPNNSVILSKEAADKLWPGKSALGRRIRPRFGGQDTISFTVVGVVNDVKQLNWKDKSQPMFYLPLTGPTPNVWRMGSPAYVVKTTRGENLKGDIRKLVKEFAPEAPVYREFTGEFLKGRMMVQLSFTTMTLGVLALLAVILGAVGLYGVLSYVVTQRTREIGVRMALGASASAVRGQVVADGTKVVLIGAVIGIVAAFFATQFLARLLFEVEPVNVVSFLSTAALMLGVGVLASYVPAKRASGVDPMEALRSD